MATKMTMHHKKSVMQIHDMEMQEAKRSTLESQKTTSIEKKTAKKVNYFFYAVYFSAIGLAIATIIGLVIFAIRNGLIKF